MNSDATSTAAATPGGTLSHAGAELVAGLAVLLRRYADRSRVTIGYRAAEHSDTVALELELGDDPTYAELLRRVHAARQSRVEGSRDDSATPPLDGLVSGAEVSAMLNGATPPAATVRSHLDTVLGAAHTDPDRCIDRLEVLSAAEREHLLVELNNTRVPYPQQCLHELVAAQAQRTPQAIAASSMQSDAVFSSCSVIRPASRAAMKSHA